MGDSKHLPRDITSRYPRDLQLCLRFVRSDTSGEEGRRADGRAAMAKAKPSSVLVAEVLGQVLRRIVSFFEQRDEKTLRMTDHRF